MLSKNFTKAIYTAVVLGSLSFSMNVGAQPCINNPARLKNISAPISSRITNFMEYLPADYNSNSNKYPLLINWSGLVQIDNASFCSLLTDGIPKIINEGRFPETVTDNASQSHSFIVIAPQVYDPYHTAGLDNAAEASALLSYILLHYRVNTTKIYMTGYSFGAYLLMDYATRSSANSSKLAGITPVSNCFPTGQADYATKLSNIVNGGADVWGLQCPSDPECSTTWIQTWVNDINAAAPGRATFTGVSTCTGSHYAWNTVYEPTYTVSGSNVYQWMVNQSSNFALPAIMKSYSARLNSGKVIVEWTTTSESNSDYFILERAGADMNFQAVNTVKAAGNSSLEIKYSLVDDQPMRGPSFYRLVLINRDAKKDYFEIKKINLPSGFTGLVNIPNPAKGTMSVYLDIPLRQTVSIRLYDLNGKLLKQIQKDFAPGVSESRFDIAGFGKGTYLVRVHGESVSVSRKVMIE